jgi:hypothetical protein
MGEPSVQRICCVGWWQQELFGRQPMRDLVLQFDAGKITGSGMDLIGPFTLSGTLSEAGQVAMVKRYLGRHSVDYVGTYDGEGVMWGEWHIPPFHDRWLC